MTLRVIIESVGDGSYCAFVPTQPAFRASGCSPEKALANIREILSRQSEGVRVVPIWKPFDPADLKRWVLRESHRRSECGYRGMGDASWRVLPSIDRMLLERGITRRDRQLAIENDLHRLFLEHCRSYLPFDVRWHFDAGYRESDRSLAWMAMQHYGCATRLLDWTNCAFTALLFAVCDQPDKDGVVWWFDWREWERCASFRWRRLGVQGRDDQECHFEAECFKPEPKTFVLAMRSTGPFRRMSLQQGFHTASPEFGRDHMELLCDDLGDRCGGVVIPAAWKSELLAWVGRIKFLTPGEIDFNVAERVAASLIKDVMAKLSR